MKRLQLQEAKARLSQVVENVQSEGPAVITVRGRDKAVLISKRDYDKKFARAGSLFDFFRSSPLRGLSLDLTRDESPPRDVKL
jgi:prevent-host-death family protein